MRLKNLLYVFPIMLLLAATQVSAATSDSRLVQAMKNRDQNTALKLLQFPGHPGLNVADGEGMTPLLWAAHWDDLNIAKQLIAAGADPKAMNLFDNSTALHEAATFGDAALIEALLKAGADPNAERGKADTALMVASRAGGLDAVKMLLAHGAKVNAREGLYGETPLMLAAAENYPDVVQTLLEHGAEVNAVSTILIVRHRPNLDATRSIDPPQGGLTALQFAAREGSLEAAKLLVAAGADLEKTDPDVNFTPLLEAVANNHFAVATMLVEKGANVKDGSLYAVMEMRTGGKNGKVLPPNFNEDSLNFAKLLIARGADVNAVFDKGFPHSYYFLRVPPGATPLHRASTIPDLAGMRLLMEAGAKPIGLKDNTTPLMLLSRPPDYGTDENTRPVPPESLVLQAMDLCLTAGYDVNQANTDGNTALHYAAGAGNDHALQFLVEHGAKLELANKKGQTPLDWAQGKKQAGYFEVNTVHESTVALIKKLMSANTASR